MASPWAPRHGHRAPKHLWVPPSPLLGSLCTPFVRITLSEAGGGEGCPCRGFILHHQEEEELESSLLEPETKEHIDRTPPHSRINLSLSLSLSFPLPLLSPHKAPTKFQIHHWGPEISHSFCLCGSFTLKAAV